MHDSRPDPQATLPPLPVHPARLVDPVERLLETVVEAPDPAPLQMEHSLSGRCVIVTGGATGIGRAICLEFARQGAHVAFSYFDEMDGQNLAAEAERTAHDLADLEVRVFMEECDVRVSTAVDGFVDRAIQALGGLHVLVNSAGTARERALWRLSDQEWEAAVDTNLTGAFHMIRAVAPTFRSQSEGKIVNVASVQALRGEVGLASSAASQAGLLALTRSAALELGPSNVNVNAVAPGCIRTGGLIDDAPAEVLDRAREHTVLGRLGDPQDVAFTVLFLCSEFARHITGAVIPVDGGHVL